MVRKYKNAHVEAMGQRGGQEARLRQEEGDRSAWRMLRRTIIQAAGLVERAEQPGHGKAERHWPMGRAPWSKAPQPHSLRKPSLTKLPILD